MCGSIGAASLKMNTKMAAMHATITIQTAMPPDIVLQSGLRVRVLDGGNATNLESYVYAEEPPLDCTLSCFGGQQDRHLRHEDLEAWREQTRGSFTLRTFPGGHFFIESAREVVLRALSEDLLRAVTGAARLRA